MSVSAMSWAWKKALSSTEKIVLVALADHADDEGICWPGHKGLTGKCGLARRSIINVIQRLVDRGLVSIEKRRREDGSYRSNRYVLHVHEIHPLVQEIHQSGAGDSPPPSAGDSHHEPSVIETTRKSVPPVAPPTDSADILEAIRLWNEMARRKNLSTVLKVTSARRKALKRRLDAWGIGGWEKAVDIVEATPWMSGDNPNGRKWNIDTILGEKVFTKLMEGGYDNGPPKQPEDGWATVVREATNG